MMVLLLALLLIMNPLAGNPAYAAEPVEGILDCSAWNVRNVGPARCEVVEDGCRVDIRDKPYTLYSTIRLPRRARYLLKWDIKLDTRLEKGAVGLALGNDHSGLIFRIRDDGHAEVLSYRKGQENRLRLTRVMDKPGSDLCLDLTYNIREKRCVFKVNDEVAFDFCTREINGVHMASSVKRVAVTTSLPGDRGGSASALHRKVHVRAE